MGMTAIVCELCGSNELTKRDGLFVCEHCGTKYTLEEARKLMGTVSVDRSGEVGNLLARAEEFGRQNEFRKAAEYIERARDIDMRDPRISRTEAVVGEMRAAGEEERARDWIRERCPKYVTLAIADDADPNLQIALWNGDSEDRYTCAYNSPRARKGRPIKEECWGEQWFIPFCGNKDVVNEDKIPTFAMGTHDFRDATVTFTSRKLGSWYERPAKIEVSWTVEYSDPFDPFERWRELNLK